jgi:hypothetical protein
MSVQVGNRTLVSKITYGTPYRTAVISASADIDAITGLVTSGAVDGSLFEYDSASGNWKATLTLRKQIIDGRVYPSDSDRAQILIRRSGTQGDPLVLRTGELAYSYLSDSGSSADGFGLGGDRLFIGAGGDSSVGGVLQSERIDVIGGKYFTDLLNHPHGVLTASSAIITDSEGKVNELKAGSIDLDSATLGRLTVSDSAIFNDLQVLGTQTIVEIIADRINVDNLTVDSSLSVLGLAAFNDSATFAGKITVSGAGVFDDTLDVAGLTTLDSAIVNNLRIDSSLDIPGALTIQGTTTFDSTATFNGEVNIGERTLSEFIDSDVFQLLRAGQAIILTYADDSDKLTISVPTATSTTPGVAFFDSAQFQIDSSGQVSLLEFEGGSF